MFLSVLLLLCVCLLFVSGRSRRPKNFPPGPTALPILGNAHGLSSSNPLKFLETLRRKYGNVYSLYVGPKAAVVVNGAEALREALVNKAVDFAGRPYDTFINTVLEHRSVVNVDYGPAWKEQRRFTLMSLKNIGMSKPWMEEKILAELQHTIDNLLEKTGKSRSAQALFHNIASNVISLLVFGKRFDYDDKFMMKFVENVALIGTTINNAWSFVHDSFHWVRSFPLPFNKGFQIVETLKGMIAFEVDEHKKSRVPGQPRDFIDCYLDELDKKVGAETSLSPEDLLMACVNLHAAATDTTSNTLLTSFLYLSTKPLVQERCQQEIDRVLNGKECASFEDRRSMPYVQAVMHECLRISGTVPLSIFHQTTRDTELMGYSIPKGTMIIPNLTSALWEEGQWKFPHEFNPENFLNDKGEFIKPDAFMPFSAGPRVCMGESLARTEVFLVLVTLLRKFRFMWPDDAGQPDYELNFGITLSPKPYSMKVELRGAQ